MPANLDDVLALKKKVEAVQRTAQRAAGALTQALQQLEKEFDVSSLEEAEEKLTGLQTEETVTQSRFEKTFDAFEKEWGEILE